MLFRSNANIDKYIIIFFAGMLTIAVNLFRLIFPYPLFKDDAFAPGGIVSSLASVHALFDRGYSSIYEFAGSGIDLAGNGFLPHTASFVLAGMTYLLGPAWAIKSTVMLKALLGFYFTSLYLRTRYSMGLIEAIFGGLLFSIQTQIVPVQDSSQTIDQFGAGLSVDLIPVIIYALYVLGLDNTIARRRIVRFSIVFFIGLFYVLSSTIPYLPICLGFIVVWYLCERAFGIDRLALLSVFLCGAGLAMFPIFYAFVLDHAYSARKGFNNFSFYNEGGLRSLISRIHGGAYLFSDAQERIFLINIRGATVCFEQIRLAYVQVYNIYCIRFICDWWRFSSAIFGYIIRRASRHREERKSLHERCFGISFGALVGLGLERLARLPIETRRLCVRHRS